MTMTMTTQETIDLIAAAMIMSGRVPATYEIKSISLGRQKTEVTLKRVTK